MRTFSLVGSLDSFVGSLFVGVPTTGRYRCRYRCRYHVMNKPVNSVCFLSVATTGKGISRQGHCPEL